VNNFLAKVHLFEAAVALQRSARQTVRTLRSVDKKISRNYLAKEQVRKLHIGCGTNLIPTWLNSDFHPNTDKVLHLDATQSFPLDGELFDYVYSEHMIEHISYVSGLNMLKESNRVLKNNGKIRISTPNFQFLIDLYNDGNSDIQQKYLKWSSERNLKNVPYAEDVYVVNNFFRDWGHLFIYDEKALTSSLQLAGFDKIVRCNLNESTEKHFQNLENTNRMPEGFLEMETITLEGTKIS